LASWRSASKETDGKGRSAVHNVRSRRQKTEPAKISAGSLVAKLIPVANTQPGGRVSTAVPHTEVRSNQASNADKRATEATTPASAIGCGSVHSKRVEAGATTQNAKRVPRMAKRSPNGPVREKGMKSIGCGLSVGAGR
jgi:hypothetical protein